MTAQLVSRNFRHINGAPARFVDVDVVLRDTSTVVASVQTDSLGFAAVYLEPDQYDWMALGARIPFDVVAPMAAPPFVHTQSAAAATWDITHNIGYKPEVLLFLDPDPTEQVYTDIVYSDENVVHVEWPSPVTGKAYIR